MKKNIENKFFIVISVLTFIFMGIGTTFAYYTSVIMPEGNDLETKSQNIAMSLNVTALYNEKKIIPTNDEDIFTAFENHCIDQHNFGACYAFSIEIVNNGIPQDITGSFKLTNDKLTHLKYLFLDADNGNEVFQGITEAHDEFANVGTTIPLDTGESKHLILVIWLSNINSSQDDETGGLFNGEFTAVGSMGNRITGTISAVNS